MSKHITTAMLRSVALANSIILPRQFPKLPNANLTDLPDREDIYL